MAMNRPRQMRCSRALLALALLARATCAAAGDSALSVRVSVVESVVFRWASDRCSDGDIPDAPARAFRDADEVIHLLASHDDNRAFTVFNGVPRRLDCRGVLDSPGDADPAHYRDHRWIAATWTDDGKTVHALVHHEYHGLRHPGACTFPDDASCWYNTITYARSEDGGRTFSQSDPPAVVAAPPFRQDVGQGRPRGFFNPTNIIKRDGFWYALMNTTGWKGQPAGTCVFRTSDIARPELWTAWNGQAFVSRFGDPYRASSSTEATCKPVARHSFGSIQRIEGSDVVLAILLADSSVGEQRRWQLAYSLSKDMVTWREPIGIASIVDFGSRNCSDAARYAYPALVDFGSASPNFDTVGTTAELFLTRFNIRDCRHSSDRDLVSRKLELFPAQ